MIRCLCNASKAMEAISLTGRAHETNMSYQILHGMQFSFVASFVSILGLILFSLVVSDDTERRHETTKDIKGANRQIDGHLVSSLHFILNSDKNILQHMTLGMFLPCKTICPVSTAQTNESCNAMYSLSCHVKL
jgi:hypothetical protein